MRRPHQTPPLRSMTGYGRAEARAGAWTLGCEVRSLNHRFLDLRVFLPEGMGDQEEEIRRSVQARAGRGRVEVRISAERRNGAAPVKVDRALARALAGAARALAPLPGVRPGLEVGRLLEYPGLVRVDTSARAGGPLVRRGVRRCVESALARLDAARGAEGRHLARDLVRRLGTIERTRRAVERVAARLPGEAARRLRQRLQEIASVAELDARRLEQEVAIVVSRSDISEELVKLAGMLQQARQLLRAARGPLGKRLDFLAQEMNREANTIGSKASTLEVTRLAVEMKTEIEKVREQVQNLE